MATAPSRATGHRGPRPWLAALLGIVPGLGHLYAGRARAALTILGLDLLLGVAFGVALMGLPGAPFNVLLPVAALAGFRIWVVIDGWRSARRRGGAWASGGRVLLACAAFALVATGAAELSRSVLNARFGVAFRIASASMEPTLLPGDYLMAEPRRGAPQRGEVVVYLRDGEKYILRIAGLPGDTLAMTDDVLRRNGRVVDEPYARVTPVGPTAIAPSSRTWGPFVVEPGTVFLLGDNRHHSFDGRFFGPTPLADVVARPTRVYWSRDPAKGRFRWGRTGWDVQD